MTVGSLSPGADGRDGHSAGPGWGHLEFPKPPPGTASSVTSGSRLSPEKCTPTCVSRCKDFYPFLGEAPGLAQAPESTDPTLYWR